MKGGLLLLNWIDEDKGILTLSFLAHRHSFEVFFATGWSQQLYTWLQERRTSVGRSWGYIERIHLDS